MKTIPHHGIKSVFRFALLFSAVFLFTRKARADIRYVDSAATGGNNGSSWVNAYTTLNQALADAQSNMAIDSILVAKGTYYPTGAQSSTNRDAAFIITRDNLKLFGGFQPGGAGGWAAREVPTNGGTGGTILSGNIYDGAGANNNSDNCYHVLICVGTSTNPIDSTLQIDGFRVIGGNANGPLYNSYLNVNGASIRRDNGGGIYNHYASPVICNSLFSGNYAFWAGGMFNYHSFMEINKCRISGNHAYNGGGGMYNEYSPLKIINSTLSGNDADGSGSSYGNGGGMFNEYSSVVITNTTVSGNDVGNDGGGIFNYTGSHPVISNSIIYGNRSGIYNYGASTVTAYSLMQGLAGTANGNLNGNTTNPLFVSPVSYNSAPTTAGDYHLQAASPCIDAGYNDSIPAGILTDMDGAARIQGNVVDMGAYEFFNPCPAFTTLYVDSSVSASGDGHDWANAMSTLSEALDLARSCSDIDSILVAGGTYYPTGVQNGSNRDSTFLIPQAGGIKLYGGYPNGGGLRDIAAYPTILSGDIGTAGDSMDNSYHVMVIANVAAAADSIVVDGFHIINGNGNDTGHVVINSISVARNSGGGLCIGQVANAGKVIIKNATFYGNRSRWGGAFYNLNWMAGQIINCLIYGNYADEGAGIRSSNTTCRIINTTIADNVSGSYGGGLNNLASHIYLVNSIVYDNEAGANNYYGDIYEYSNLQSANYCNIGGTNGYTGAGNLHLPPAFTNPAAGDYTLSPCSPLINKGNNDSIPAAVVTDLAGGQRVYDTNVDMGAYEFQSVQPDYATAVYVDSLNGNDGNDGASWTTAFKTLSYALFSITNSACYANVDSILVAKGTYYPTGEPSGTNRTSTFLIPRPGGIKLYGGFQPGGAGGWAARVLPPANGGLGQGTILSGDIGTAGDSTDNSLHVMVIANVPANADSIVVDGFSFTAAYATYGATYNGTYLGANGAGIYLYKDSIATRTHITNCNFYGNSASSGSGYGGGMYNAYSSPLVTNCNFTRNTVYGSNSGYGGGMTNYYASPVLINCNFKENTASAGLYTYGGGMFNYYSAPSISNCMFSGNTASGGNSNRGGGIYNQSSSPVMTNSLFSGNSAVVGGGVFNYLMYASSAPVTTNCTFTGNTAGAGGGVYNVYATATPLLFTNCTFTDNQALTGSGGGMCNDLSVSAEVINCSFSGNSAGMAGFGGGICHYSSHHLSLDSCVFSGNTAGGGGGVLNKGTSTDVSNCVFYNNVANNGTTLGTGGGFQNSPSAIGKFSNCVFAGNSAAGTADDGGGALMLYGGTVYCNNVTFYENTTASALKPNANAISISSGATLNMNNSIVWGNAAHQLHNSGTATVKYTDVKGGFTGTGNMNTDPIFTNPANPLGADSAWGTADDGLTLAPCTPSPLIDMGHNSSIPAGITTDITGGARIYNGIVDMGAYESRELYGFPSDTTTYTVCYGDSVAFRGVYYSASGQFTDTVAQTTGCDSLYVLDLTILPPTDTLPVQTVDSCYQVTFEGQVFLSDTILSNAYSYASIACDSAYREVVIHVFHPDTVTLSEAICFSDTLFIATQAFYASGQYQVLLSNSSGCDSVINLQLQVNPIKDTLISAQICSGDTYLFDGQNLGLSGIYVDTIAGGSATGCDSIITLNLTVNPAKATTLNESICSNESYSFQGQALTASGTYYDTLQTTSGCDSVITLHLTVNPAKATTLNESICSNESYNFNGQVLTTAGTYYDTLQTVSGCDSAITLHLTVNPAKSITLNESICSNESYNFKGQALTASGTYYDTLQTVAGCDSVIILQLTVNPAKATTLNESICSNAPYSFNGQNLTTAGTYYDTLQTALGCDSVITLHLTVKPAYEQSLTLSLCAGSLPYIFGTQSLSTSGVYTETFTTTQGCDSMIHLTLNVNPEYDLQNTMTVCEQDLPLAFGAQSLATAGNYTELFASVYGCDSLVHLSLVVNPTLHTQADIIACAADLPYSFGSQSLSAPGSYTEVFTAATGCDSIVDLLLTVLPLPQHLTIDTAACGSVVFENVTYNQNTLLQDTLFYTQGCDSVYRTVHIQVWNPPLIMLSLDSTNCDVVTYEGQDYYTDTLLTKMFTDLHGCDSLLRKVNIHVLHSVKDTIVADICSGESYWFNGTAYDISGVYSAVFPYFNGCDSSMTIVLQVHEPPSVRIHVEDKPGGYCIGDEITLTGEGAAYYHWWAGYGKDYGDGPEAPILLIDRKDSFFVQATNDWNCSDTASVQIEAGHCCEIFVPNAFSPNDDGLNDGFGVATNGNPREFTLQIFNRLGKRVFIGYRPEDKWNGTIMGQPAPMDTYYYLVTGYCANGSSIRQKGELVLIR